MLWKHPTLLLVDDDEVAVMAFERAIAQQKISIPVLVARDGDEALEILGDPGRLKAPYVVILDLNMPRMSGHEVLPILKSDPELAAIPVIVMTNSRAEKDVVESYTHGANSYFVKPGDFAQMLMVMQNIGRYWFELVELPAH